MPTPSSEKSPLIELRDIHRTFVMGSEKVHALRGIDLTITHGEFTAIMGSSGSGKSTLMNVIGLLDRPSSGSYLLEGKDVSRLSSSQRAIVRNQKLGFVFQSFHLLARTSAQENVALPLLYAGVPRKERMERAAEALRRVGLGSRLDHRPNEMSGGQQQRVAVARAMVTQPGMILADEPTGNLDTRTTIEIMELFQELAESGITVVLVTHENEVASFTSRILWVRDGQLRLDQPHTPHQVVETPDFDVLPMVDRS